MSGTSATRTTRVRHEWNFDFGNDTSENIFPHLYISYMVNERLQGEEQFHSKNDLLKNASFPCQKVLEKCTTKTELCNEKNYIKKLHTTL